MAAWHHRAYLHKTKSHGTEVFEVVAIGIEACGDAYAVAEGESEDLALQPLMPYVVALLERPSTHGQSPRDAQ